jgi:GT2 family glycosyltransferase
MTTPSALKYSTVAAVVVTYNREALLAECLDALLAQSQPLDAIYVIDNASTDGTADLIASRYANSVKYERLPENIGGSGGFHHGMSRAYDDGFDYIWVMDDDVRPEPDCLHELLAHTGSAGVLAPLHISLEGEIVEPVFVTVISEGREKRDSIRNLFKDEASLPQTIRLDDFTFEGPLFHKSVIAKAGLPRPDYFIGSDDCEYAWRIAAHGCGPMLCVTSARMVCTLPRVSSEVPNWRYYYIWRNHLHVRRAYARNIPASWAVDARFFSACLKGLVTRRLNGKQLALRIQAWMDSFCNPLPRRYLPPQPIARSPAAPEPVAEKRHT